MLRAREVAGEAFKLPDAAKDDARKAVSLLNLTTFFMRIDEARVQPTTQAAIKVINNLPAPKRDEKAGSEARNDYLDGPVGIPSSLAVVFQRLSQKDEGGTYSLASRLERPELKASAMLGTLMGLPDIEAEAGSSRRAPRGGVFRFPAARRGRRRRAERSGARRAVGRGFGGLWVLGTIKIICLTF